MVRLKTAVVVELAMIVFALTSAHLSSAAGAPAPLTQNPQNQSKAAAPASGCALLPVSLIEKIFGETFEAQPQETKAPPAYKGAWGSSCKYFSKPPFAKGQQTRVDFLVYVEASAAEAKQTFEKAGMFFEDRSKPKASGNGESAYWAREGRAHDSRIER